MKKIFFALFAVLFLMTLLESAFSEVESITAAPVRENDMDGSAINRRAEERLIQTDVLWAIFNPKGYPAANSDAAWTDLMCDKLTFRSIWVNTLSRKRDGICFIGKTQKDFEGTQIVRMFKTSDGKSIPVQYVADSDERHTCSMYADLSRGAEAPNIPAFGVIEVEPDKTETFETTGSFHINAKTGEMRSRRIHLIIDTKTGTIKSLKIPGSAHDFAAAGSGLNDYSSEPRTAVSGSKLTVLADGPLVASMLVEINSGDSNSSSLKRQITIFEDNEKVRIENILDKKTDQPKETFFVFPFNVPDGKWYIDTPQALVEAGKEPSGTNRNDYCVSRYCTLANENCGVNWVTVDADRVQLTEMNHDRTLYSLVCNNQGKNGNTGQGGQLMFEYWIWIYVKATFNNGIAQRFARQVHQPILLLRADNRLTAKPELLKLTNEGSVITTSVKPARDGNGALLVGLFNPTMNIQETKITPSEPYKAVYKSNQLEEKFELLDKLELNPQETVTVRIE